MGCLTLAAVMSCAALSFAQPARTDVSAASDAEVQSVQEQMNNLAQQQKDLLAKINSLKSQASEASAYKQSLDSYVTTVTAKISAAESLIEELTQKIAETETAIAEHEESMAKTHAKFIERMRASQEDGNASYLSMILGASSIGDFLSKVDRVNSMLEYDRNVLKQYKEEKEQLESEKAKLEESKTLQQETIKTLEADKADSQAKAAEAASYYEQLKNDTSQYQSEYEKAKAAEEQLDAQLTAMLQEIASRQQSSSGDSGSDFSPNAGSGDFIWPLPSGGYVSCNFGDSDPGGRPHYAMDCAIAYGTPIYACASGTVVTASSHSSYGNYVVIDHGGGIATLYAHCSGLAVSAGQSVQQGQVIGYVGSTGYSTGNHLHLEFRVNGQKVNPRNYIG